MVREAGKYQRTKQTDYNTYVGRTLTLHIFCFFFLTLNMYELRNRNASTG